MTKEWHLHWMKWFTILFWKSYKIEKIGHSWYSDFYLFLMISRAVFWQDSQIQITHKIATIHNMLTFQIMLKSWNRMTSTIGGMIQNAILTNIQNWVDWPWWIQRFLFIFNDYKSVIVDNILEYKLQIKSSKFEKFWFSNLSD